MSNQPINITSNIIIECSQTRATTSNETYSWTNDVGGLDINKGDEISVYQSFINVRGAGGETINIVDEEIEGENASKTPIEIQYYKNCDGINNLLAPYSLQLLSLGTLEPNVAEFNSIFAHNSTSYGSRDYNKMKGFFMTGKETRNLEFTNKISSYVATLSGTITATFSNIHLSTESLICNLQRPIDCSRYTIMEVYRDATYIDSSSDNYGFPFIKHRIKTGTHTFNLADNFYTPQGLSDNLTKSINNSTIENALDENNNVAGINISSPAFITQKGLYRSRKDYGGTDEYGGTNFKLGTGEYLPISVYGFDMGSSTDRVEYLYNESTTTYMTTNMPYLTGSGNNTTGNLGLVSEYWFRPCPSWDFYGGTNREEVYGYDSTSIFTGTNTHINYAFRHPETLMLGEQLFNSNIGSITSGDVEYGDTGTINSGLAYTDANLLKFKNFFDKAYLEGVYDDLEVRNLTQIASTHTKDGTTYDLNPLVYASDYVNIKYNHNNHRLVSVSNENPTGSEKSPLKSFGSNFGSVSENRYYGFDTNSYGYNYGVHQIGLVNYKNTCEAHTNIFLNYLGTGIENRVIQNQLIKYDNTLSDTFEDGYGFGLNINGSLCFEISTSEGGGVIDYRYSALKKQKLGWFPNFLDIHNSAICCINPDGLGSKSDTYIFTPADKEISTLTYQRKSDLEIELGSNPPLTATEFPKGMSSANPNVNIGCEPLFNFDTGLSRFTISNLYTSQMISNSETATTDSQLVSNAGSNVAIFNPIFQQSRNRFINKFANSGTNLFDARRLPRYFNNAVRNMNTIIKKPIIMDSQMGIFISKFSATDLESSWNNSLFAVMGFSYNSLHATNTGRNFRNEDYLIGSNPLISTPPTNNANIDISYLKEFSRNNFNFPTFHPTACDEVLQREISATSTEILSDELPIKDFTPYYLIESNILEFGGYDEYRQSQNILPVIDICSLNYNSSDFYFAEPSGLIKQATKDYRLSAITTNIRRPDGLLATELSGKSSIIYKITKSNLQYPYQEPNLTENFNLLNKLQSGKALKGFLPSMKSNILQSYRPVWEKGLLPDFDFEGNENEVEEEQQDLVDEVNNTLEQIKENKRINVLNSFLDNNSDTFFGEELSSLKKDILENSELYNIVELGGQEQLIKYNQDRDSYGLFIDAEQPEFNFIPANDIPNTAFILEPITNPNQEQNIDNNNSNPINNDLNNNLLPTNSISTTINQLNPTISALSEDLVDNLVNEVVNNDNRNIMPTQPTPIRDDLPPSINNDDSINLEGLNRSESLETARDIQQINLNERINQQLNNNSIDIENFTQNEEDDNALDDEDDNVSIDEDLDIKFTDDDLDELLQGEIGKFEKTEIKEPTEQEQSALGRSIRRERKRTKYLKEELSKKEGRRPFDERQREPETTIERNPLDIPFRERPTQEPIVSRERQQRIERIVRPRQEIEQE